MSRRFSYFFWPRPPARTLIGYLANWKIFEPKMVRPVSIEPCIAPMAVMTEMTEKTPMVMPSMVSAERSLFAPTEASAIVRISRNCIGFGRRAAKQQGCKDNLFEKIKHASDSMASESSRCLLWLGSLIPVRTPEMNAHKGVCCRPRLLTRRRAATVTAARPHVDATLRNAHCGLNLADVAGISPPPSILLFRGT